MPAESTLPPPARRRALGGLLVRRERWTLSLKAKVLVLVAGIAAGLAVVRFLYPFLAITDKVHGQYLVVEGWIPPETLKYAVAEFKGGDYREILTSGCIVRDRLNSDVKVTYADWAAADLRKLGIPAGSVQAIPCGEERTDRTYSSALAVKAWLDEHRVPVESLDLVTLGPHARRSRLLYEEAFGRKVKVGVIAIPSPDYDANHWWRYSEGVREVIGEGIGYLYVKFLFWPSGSDQGNPS
jgi:DUF218 domain